MSNPCLFCPLLSHQIKESLEALFFRLPIISTLKLWIISAWYWQLQITSKWYMLEIHTVLLFQDKYFWDVSIKYYRMIFWQLVICAILYCIYSLYCIFWINFISSSLFLKMLFSITLKDYRNYTHTNYGETRV